MLKNLTIFNVKYLWRCCILHSCQVLGGKWLVWFGLLRVVPYNMASLATVYLGRANSFMVLFVLTAVHPLKSQPSTAWYCIQLDNGEGITQVRLKRKKENPVSRLWVVCLIWFGVYNVISVEKNDREISGLHDIEWCSVVLYPIWCHYCEVFRDIS